MEPLFTKMYDEMLKKELKHFQNYPQMLPFIGSKWEESPQKILLLGESHFIVGEELKKAHPDRTHLTDWYNNDSGGLHEYYTNYINTRKVVEIAENIGGQKQKKSLLIYYNLKKELKNHFPQLNNEQLIFPFFSFYNYFQRPAFSEKISIDNKPVDDEVAYHTLKTISYLIKPHKIIFTSKKAAASFYHHRKLDNSTQVFNNIVIDHTTHPSCSWWNKPSKPLGGRTGKQKFIDILSLNFKAS